MNTQPNEHWIFVVDHRSGRLVRGQLSQGRSHLEEVGRVANEWTTHHHERPSSLFGHGAHAYPSLHHETEEVRSRWAKTVAAWLAQHVGNDVARVTVVGPGHLLGALRKAWPAHLAQRIDAHEGELSALTTSELTRHPRIAALLGGPREP